MYMIVKILSWNRKKDKILFTISSDLPRDAALAITILDNYSPKEDAIVGGTTITFFGKSGNFRLVMSTE